MPPTRVVCLVVIFAASRAMAGVTVVLNTAVGSIEKIWEMAIALHICASIAWRRHIRVDYLNRPSIVAKGEGCD
jgi:hypothetical protein